MEKEKLLGDIVEEQLKKAKVDKVVKAIEKRTGEDCGCGKRKQQLNNLHRKIRGKT